jgi:hypothetical protein
MPLRPNKIVDTDKAFKKFLYNCGGVFFSLVTLNCLADGSEGTWLAIVITLVCFSKASNIKTEYNYRGTYDYYD